MNETETGTIFILYCCQVCGRTITDREPYYASSNLNCRHGNIVYVMSKVGTVPQITYDDRERGEGETGGRDG